MGSKSIFISFNNEQFHLKKYISCGFRNDSKRFEVRLSVFRVSCLFNGTGVETEMS